MSSSSKRANNAALVIASSYIIVPRNMAISEKYNYPLTQCNSTNKVMLEKERKPGNREFVACSKCVPNDSFLLSSLIVDDSVE